MDDRDYAGTLERLIAGYCSLGIHRTGWQADDDTSEWIAGWLAARGVEARTAWFAFGKLQCRSAFVEVDGRRVEGTPLYDAGATGAIGVEGGPGRFVVVEGAAGEDLHERLRIADGETALLGAVAVTGDPDGFVMLRNAERMASPLSFPVLQVAKKDAGALLERIAGAARTRLVIYRDVVAARASNVVANLPVQGSDGLVVLMTPKSGWFSCAAERGGGVALAMMLACEAAAMPGRRKDLRVLFTSGHELGHQGLLNYLEDNRDLRERASLWIHLGASLGARYPQRMQVFSRAQDWREWFMPVLERHGAGPVSLAGQGRRPGGEAREVFEQPFVSIAGHHAYFHSPRDLPEIAVDAESVARYGRALRDLLEKALR